MPDWKNKLFFGDNLDVLRKDIPDECVDLIYRGSLWITQATETREYAVADDGGGKGQGPDRIISQSRGSERAATIWACPQVV